MNWPLAALLALMALAIASGVAQFVRAERRAERLRRAVERDETDEAGA